MSVNLGRVAYVEKGAYDSGTTYEKKDVVLFNGGSYVFIADTPAAGKQPTDTAYWQPLIDTAPMLEATANATEAAAAANEARQNIQNDLAGKAPAIFVDASGDIVQIADGAEGMPVKSLVTHIEPVQDGEGAPSKVTAQRTGKNWFSGAEEITFVQRSAYTKLDCPLAPGTYTISALVTSTDTDATVCWVGFVGGDTNGGIAYAAVDRNTRSASIRTLSYPVSEVFFNASASYAESEGDTATWKQVQIELGTTATEYEPYQGGQSVSADLPETVYGGTLDWGTGVLTSTLDADGNELTQPKVFQLTPQQLSTLKGTNNIWSNAGATEVTYAADTKMYIDRKIAAIAAAIV